MATKLKRDKKQESKDDIASDIIMAEVCATRTSRSLQTASEVGNVTDFQTSSLLLGERIDRQKLSEETEQALFNKPFCPRWVDSSTESRLQTGFDIYHERKMQHKITTTAQVNINSDDTRLVNGLLTTTLCSTEL